ncbi:MAG: bifunctional acetate--CoA ligase family protein/GNAT family N-acetyltransferase [Candidatus Hadarchaeota archaeon]
MPIKNLEYIFEPINIAVIGASEKAGSVGLALMNNLKDRRIGKTFPINPNRDEILNLKAYSAIGDVPENVDLGIVATPAPVVPEVVEQCGNAGVPALIVISAGFSETGKKGEKLERKVEKIRREYDMRILGPNCLGVINPSADLNASFTDQMPDEGNLAFLSQSGALASSTLDWAISAKIGFSSFVSVGNMLDVDFADLIDYFGRDRKTDSILTYIEAIQNPEEFMSAARSIARTKPIMTVKSGKHEAGAKAVASHTGSLAGSDEVYNAAFRRAGITRVDTIEDLFTCSETLAKQNLPDGPNLAIVTNAGGPGAKATDSLIDNEGKLASLSEETKEKLEDVLPKRASKKNPVDVTGDATPEQYRKSTQICLEDEGVDGVLCIYAPLGTLKPIETAESLIGLKENTDKPILPCWMGGSKIEEGSRILRDNGYSVQNAPEQSIKSYMYLYRYSRNLESLLETPEELSLNLNSSKEKIRDLFRDVIEEDREILTERESKQVLDLYQIPSPEIRIANSPEEASKMAEDMGFPVVLKIHSKDITHKRKFGGVLLNINSKKEAEDGYRQIIENVQEKKPEAQINGVSVQKMIKNSNMELILGSSRDQTFGSTLMFGRGGSDVELYKDTAFGLPPLNQTLARHMMEETKIYNFMKESEDFTDRTIRKLEKDLVKLSQIIIDFPEIEELDINPISIMGEDLLALDARIILDKDKVLSGGKDHNHLVIEPYPEKYVEDWELKSGEPVTLRPIRPEDEPMEFKLFQTFSGETWEHRFFGSMREVNHKDMVRYTNIDYRREMAIIGEIRENDEKKMIGVGRLVIDPDGESGEFAVVVGDPWQNKGLGEKLIRKMIEVGTNKDLNSIYGTVRRNNKGMIKLCKEIGFEVEETEKRKAEEKLKLREFETETQKEETVRIVYKI